MQCGSAEAHLDGGQVAAEVLRLDEPLVRLEPRLAQACLALEALGQLLELLLPAAREASERIEHSMCRARPDTGMCTGM